MTTQEEIRAAVSIRESLERIQTEEEGDPKDIDEPTLRIVKRLHRDTNALLRNLYDRDIGQNRGTR